MNIHLRQLNEIKPVEKFLLSFPLRPDLYAEIQNKFAPMPLIIINQTDEILFGVDLFYYLETLSIIETPVIQLHIDDKDALFLNYNRKNQYTGLNLYEKLVFIKRIISQAEPEEIYRQTGLDIPITPELIQKLDLLLSTSFRDALINEHIDMKTANKLCDFHPDDIETLMQLFIDYSFSSSHRLKILEMVEELLFRDKCRLEEIFQKLHITDFKETERPQKKIIDQLFTYRYPQYSEAEERWQKEIKSLKIPGNVKVTHYPFFEKKQIDVTMQVTDIEELKTLLEKISGKSQ